jgi:Amidohydrolase family
MLKKLGIAVAILVAALSVIAALTFAALLPPAMHVPPQRGHAISGVTIWNPGEIERTNQTIIISGGRISEIRDTQPGDAAPLCPGCFVMPGLIDAHVHTPPKLAIGNQRLFSLLYLKYGVTSVRDLGQLDGSVAALQSDIKAGKIAGPRMYRCGPALDGADPAFPGAVSIADSAHAIVMVKQLASGGVDCIKTYTNLPKAAFEGAGQEAAKQKLPLVGHTPHPVNLRDVSNFEIQHFNGVPYLHSAPPQDADYRSEDLIAMSEADIVEVIALMKANAISILPTVANGKARLTASDRVRFPPTPGVKHLPALWEKAWPNIISHPETHEEIDADLAAIPVSLAFLGKARASGVDVLAGSDVVMPYVIPGESLHLEMAMLAEAFGSDQAALEAATLINGRHIDRGQIGQVAVGAYADLLLLKRDPRLNLSAAQDWQILITDGRMYTRADIEQAVAKSDRHFRDGVYSAVMNFAYGFLVSEYSDAE